MADLQLLVSTPNGGRRGLLGALAIDSFANGAFIPGALIYLSSQPVTSIASVGEVLTAATLLALPVPLVLGWLPDRFDGRLTLLTAQALQAAGFCIYLSASSLPIAFCAALRVALGSAVFWSSAFVLIARISDHDTGLRARGRLLTKGWSLRAVGYGTGVAAVGLQSLPVFLVLICVNIVLLLIAAVIAVALIPTWTTTAPSDAPIARGNTISSGYRALVRNRSLISLFTLNIAFMLCNATLSIGLGPYVVAAAPRLAWTVGPVLALNTVARAALLPVVVRSLCRFRQSTALCAAGALCAIWGLLTAGAPILPAQQLQVAVLVGGVLCYSLAQMVHSSTSNAIAADAVSENLRTRYLALFPSTFAIAATIAPLQFSSLKLNDVLPWVVLAAIALLTIPATLAITARLPAHAGPAPQLWRFGADTGELLVPAESPVHKGGVEHLRTPHPSPLYRCQGESTAGPDYPKEFREHLHTRPPRVRPALPPFPDRIQLRRLPAAPVAPHRSPPRHRRWTWHDHHRPRTTRQRSHRD